MSWYSKPTHYKNGTNLIQQYHHNLKKILSKRLVNPHNPTSKLRGELKNAYKIKLRSSGYRLVYLVEDHQLIVLVLAVGKRDKSFVYNQAAKRI